MFACSKCRTSRITAACIFMSCMQRRCWAMHKALSNLYILQVLHKAYEVAEPNSICILLCKHDAGDAQVAGRSAHLYI